MRGVLLYTICMRRSVLLQFATAILCALLVYLPGFHMQLAFAATLTNPSDTLSNTTANATSVTHTIAFTTATTDLIKQIRVHFTTTQGGGTKPAGLDLSSATLGTVTNLGAGWSIDTTFASTGYLLIGRATAGTVNSGVNASIDLSSITNSAIDDCQSSNDILQDTCSVHIATYSDDGSTEVDSADTTYTVTEDPYLNFDVEDVPSGQTHNGVTSNVSTTATSVALGHLDSGTVRYGTQKITISTNAPHGYFVSAKLLTNWSGDRYTNNDIDPFGATNATWTNPVAWVSPDGTSPNVNTGWFGANTSDTRVSGWSSGSGKFGPLNQNPHTIIVSTTPERSGVTIYLSYAIEVNGLQASDSYTAKIVYDVQPTF